VDDQPGPGAPTDLPDDDGPRASPVPIAIALAVVVVVGVLSWAFLRTGDEGELVRPDRLVAVDDDTVRATALALPACREISRAQVDLDANRVFLELVAVEVEGCDLQGVVDVVAEVTLPEPLGDRRLVAGVGRLHLPCTGRGADVACGPAR
jgi:hypothetical protein